MIGDGTPVSAYHAAIETLTDSYAEGIRAFATWVAANWTITEAEWKRDFAEPPPGGPDYFTGYNAGVAAVVDAVEAFLGDFHP